MNGYEYIEILIGVSTHTLLDHCGKQHQVEWLGLLLVNVLPLSVSLRFCNG
jgi:hypothetical protein